jgi:hypothetical protein
MIALGSAWADAGDRLAPAVAAASRAGFRALHASRAPADAAKAKAAADAAGVRLTGVDADPGLDVSRALPAAIAAAAALRAPLVVLDSPRAPADGSREEAVEVLARLLHATFSREPGLAVAVRHAGGGAPGLLGIEEAEWLLSALGKRPAGLWLDPWRAASAKEARAPSALDWADRLGRRVLGLSLRGAPGPRGPDLPPEGLLDWRALREAVPAGAPRVLEVGPHVSERQVSEARRRFEESLRY